MKQTANIVEIFSSIQGEGIYVGHRQVFVRFYGCNLQCVYCDTPAFQKQGNFALVETKPGQREFSTMANPMELDELAARINCLLAIPHHSVSLTGGEPLCQWPAIKELAPHIRGRIYLETNGTLFNELEQVLPYVDIISMDIKLPSSGSGALWSDHRAFLEIAARRSVFVKIVITGSTGEQEFGQALQVVKDISADIPVILQPVTPNGFCAGITPDEVLKLQDKALTIVRDVRVIPQTHKFMGQL
jgi:organic radical activating enzyme